MLEDIISELKKDEGFRGEPYNDTEGFPTIGFGTKLPLTQNEALWLLEHRLQVSIEQLEKIQPIFKDLPIEAKKIIANMIYQMGVGGVLNFRKMWGALKAGDYKLAGREMRDSRWYKQTPNRAERLAKRMELLDV
jgi:lysozyme